MSPQSSEALLRLPEVRLKTGLARSSIYRMEAAGQFPARVSLSTRSVAWRLADIECWIGSRPSKVATGGAA